MNRCDYCKSCLREEDEHSKYYKCGETPRKRIILKYSKHSWKNNVPYKPKWCPSKAED